MSSIVGGDDDLISSLPDTIIGHILSFLLTKQVVATSILSKRWTHLWRSVPVINVKERYPIQLGDKDALIRFNDLMYSVLLSRGSNFIKSFSIKIRYGDLDLANLGFPSVFKWINHVAQQNVESVDIYVYTAGNVYKPKLPNTIFSCKTLVVLKLKYFHVEGFSFVRLPSLKILRLKYCTLLDARDLVLFLSGCPILEDLNTYPRFGGVCKDSLSYQDCESLSLSKLTRARMKHTFCHFPLKALHNVEELYIEVNKVYRSFDEIPTFHNLTKLKLHSINSNWDLLFQMLNHCPNLQNVELSQGTAMGGRRDNVQQNWMDPKFVPQCLSLHLKTCTLWLFEGEQDELQLATFILNNATVLQTMKIVCHLFLKKVKELSLCSKASPTCELIFHVWNYDQA